MDREQFLDSLAMLVEEGTITEVEAAELLQQYDSGEITQEDLPVPQEGMFAPLWPFEADFWTLLALSDITLRAIDNVRMARNARRMRDVLDEMGFQTDATGRTFQRSPGPSNPDEVFESLGAGAVEMLQEGRAAARSGLQAMTQQQRRSTAYEILDIFKQEADTRTQRLLFSGRYDDGLRRWQTAMRGAIRGDILTFAELGKGAPLDQADLRALRPAMQRQMAHLSRFAEEIAVRKEAGDAMSRDQIQARLKMYSGDALTTFYLQREARLGEDYVVRYQARDDDRTCSPCLEAEEGGPYLPGRGPMPGADTCLGRGHCRCSRIPELNPSLARQLRSQPVTA